MRKLVTGFAVVVCAFALVTSSASASTVTIGSQGSFMGEIRGGVYTGGFSITTSGIPSIADGTLMSFCVELHENVYFGATYNAQANTKALKGGEAVSDPLDPRTAWLYNQYLTGGIVLSSNANFADFAEAVWMLEDEIPVATNTYYAQALLSTWTDIGPIRVLNLGTAPVWENQDVLIPEPATMSLLGLGGLLFCRKRRAQA